MSEMLTNRQHICDHLRRMKLVRQAVPYRNSCIFCKFLDDLLSVSTVLDSVEHSSEHTSRICDALLLSDLGSARIKISHMHTEIMCRHLEGTARSGTRFLKDQCDVLANQTIMHDSLVLLLLKLCG